MFKQIRSSLIAIKTIVQFNLLQPITLPIMMRLLILPLELLFQSSKYKNTEYSVRVKLAIIEMGPVFIKLGQLLSTRIDLFPADIIMELNSLTDKLPGFSPNLAKQIIVKELSINNIDEHFSYFEQQPLGAASIAQVHAARLVSGEDVVIKILRPKIKKQITDNLGILYFLARLIANYHPNAKYIKPLEIIKEIQRILDQEIDLRIEAANASQFKHNMKNIKSIMVPSIYHKYSSKNMLVQERVYGINIDDIKQLKEHNINLKVLAKEGFNLFFTQAFEHKFFHADLHRGNLFVDPANPEKPKILTIDFGIMGTLTETDQVYLAKNFIAFFNRDYYECAKLHQQSGWLPADSDVNAFATAIRTFSEPMWQQPLKHISMADTLMQLFNTAQKFNMHVQPQLLLLQKSLVCIEGISRNLDPDLNMWEVAKPFFQKWLHNRSKFITRLKNVVKNTPVWLEKASKLIENKQTEKVIVYKNSYSHVIIAFILGLTLASLYTIPTTTLVTLP